MAWCKECPVLMPQYCLSVKIKVPVSLQTGKTVFISFFSNTQPVELMLHVISCILRCDLVRLKNVIQERVHDHFGYAGMICLRSLKHCMYEFTSVSDAHIALKKVDSKE